MDIALRHVSTAQSAVVHQALDGVLADLGQFGHGAKGAAGIVAFELERRQAVRVWVGDGGGADLGNDPARLMNRTIRVAAGKYE
ncbi:hypothetical protein LMCDFJHI_01760 [Aeromonas salmonicida]